MVLSPQVYAHFSTQIRILTSVRTMVVAVVADYRSQLVYLDPSECDIYEIAYRAMRDGEQFIHAADDLMWDLWCMCAEFDISPRRVYHRNGTSQ